MVTMDASEIGQAGVWASPAIPQLLAHCHTLVSKPTHIIKHELPARCCCGCLAQLLSLNGAPASSQNVSRRFPCLKSCSLNVLMSL